MFEAYKVSVSLSLVNGVSAGLLSMSRDLAKAQGGVTVLQSKLNKLKETGKKAAYQLTTAFAIASPFALAITDAAKLQKEMIGIQQATGATTRQLNDMRSAIEKTAGQTMFSVIDVARMGKTIGTGTTLTPDQVTALLPEYAKFADVQLLLKGTPALQSVTEAVRLSHTAGHYDPESLRTYLDQLNKLSLVIPGGLGEAGNALKYSQAVAKNALGMSDTSTIEMVALLNQLGFSGSRGGTNFIAAATRSIPGIFGSGLLKGESGTALREMGLSDQSGRATFFKDGKFSTEMWMKGMAAFVARSFEQMPEAEARQYILKHFQKSLGTNGQRVAELLATPQALTQLLAIDEKFKRLPSVDQTQGVFADKSVVQGFENAKTNITSLFTELGYPLLPDVQHGLAGLNGTLQEMITSVRNHPARVRALTFALAGLSGSLLFAGTINLLKYAFGSLAATSKLLLSPIRLLVAPLEALAGVGIATIAGGLVVFGAAIAGIAAVLGKGNVAKLGGYTDGLGGSSYNPLNWIQGAGEAIGRSFAPTGHNPRATIDVQVSDPYHLTKLVTQTQTNSMSKATSPSSDYFDYRSTPGLAGGW